MQFGDQHFKRRKLDIKYEIRVKSPVKRIHLVPVLNEELNPANRVKPILPAERNNPSIIQNALGTHKTNDILVYLFNESMHESNEAGVENGVTTYDDDTKRCVIDLLEKLVSGVVNELNSSKYGGKSDMHPYENASSRDLPVERSGVVTRVRKVKQLNKSLQPVNQECENNSLNNSIVDSSLENVVANDLIWECDDEDLMSAVGVDVLNEYRNGVISVSDVSRQFWCEQQLLYTFMYPFIEDEEGNIIRVDDKPHINTGTDLHETRELEVHVKRDVKCETREDSYAIRLLNMLTSFEYLYSCSKRQKRCVVREVPIFGEPFSLGLYFRGVIDEINYDPAYNCLGVVEFKTRLRNSMPSDSQSFTHSIQVNLYRKLLNDLITGVCSKSVYFKKYKLDPNLRFSDTVLAECNCYATNLNVLFDIVMSAVRKLPLVKRGWVEYMFQESKKIVKSTTVNYNDNDLKSTLIKASGFWLGTRPCQGVEIEETWKCKMCAYIDCCEWRLNKTNEIRKQKSSKP